MKTPLVACAVAALFMSVAAAGDAFFSLDGKTVTFAPLVKTGILYRLEIDSGKLTELPLPAGLKEETPGGVARGAQGETLFTAGNAAWVLKDDGTAKRLCDLGPAKDASNLFVATKPETPVTDWLFASAGGASGDGSQIFYARKPGAKSFKEVFCRRIDHVDCGCFTDDGRFFFAGRGDVWEGGFATEDDPEAPVAALIGARVAPVAALNTDSANAGSMFVSGLCPAGKWLYTGLRGRHMGCILRLPLPGKTLYSDEAAELPDPKAQLDAMRASLEKTELLVADTGGLSAFTACEIEGQGRVFYRAEGDEDGIGLWLWDGRGAPKRIANEPRE